MRRSLPFSVLLITLIFAGASSATSLEHSTNISNTATLHSNPPKNGDAAQLSPIQRHKTAIRRTSLSSPMKALEKHGYLNGDYSVFDYGCGRGDDLKILQELGITASGWDPIWAANVRQEAADIVNLGFVINVIESPRERAETLKAAWSLSKKMLVVSARVAGEAHIKKFTPYGDGVITQQRTFQKYYSQQELKRYIEQVTKVEAVPVASGVYFVYRQ